MLTHTPHNAARGDIKPNQTNTTMKSAIASFIGNTVGAVGSFTGGVMMGTGINPGGLGDHLHRAGNEFAHGMHQQAERIDAEAVAAEEKRHEERNLEIAAAALAEHVRHQKAIGAA